MKYARKKVSSRGVVAAIIALMLLIGGGIWIYNEQESAVKATAVEKLSMIGQLKAAEITKWRLNILADAAVYADSASLRANAERYLSNPTPENAAPLLKRFQCFRENNGYYDVLLIDSNGVNRLSLSGKLWDREGYSEVLEEAFEIRRPLMTELHKDKPDGFAYLSVVSPFTTKNGGDWEQAGALVLIDNADNFLFPQLRVWPAPTATAETILMRREGDTALYISPLRYRKKAELNLFVSLASTNTPGVQAILGGNGVVEGVDYRGEQVQAYVQPIDQSDWYMVAKQDSHEIFAEWQQRSRLIMILWASLAVCVITVGAAVRYSSQKRHFRDLYETETALRMSAERSDVTLRAIGDGVIVTDADGRIEMVNASAVSMTGWTEAEALGRMLDEVFNVVDEKTRDPLPSPIERVLQRGKTITFGAYSMLLSKLGQEIPVSDSAAPVRDNEGHIIGIVLVFRDLTLERNYSTLFQRMLNGFSVHEVIYNNDGHAVDFRFLDVNPAFEMMTGLARYQVVGKTILEVLPETDLVWIEKLCSVVESGESIKFDDYAHHFDKNFEISAFRTGPQQFAAVYLDVTEQRRAEVAREEMWEQLLQAQKVESVGRLAGGVAHDFNNMLGVIMGNAELALEMLAADAPVRAELHEIMKAGQRAADVTRQLLAFARKQVISPKVLNPNETIEGMLKMLRSLLGENVEIEWLPAKSLPTIKIDPAQLSQILANLCLNSRDAIKDVGKITIESSVADVDADYCTLHADCEPGQYVLISVSDNGSGMSPEVLSHLFEPFFTTKETGVGTGLGLSTVHGIIKQNNGFISVYSEENHGTTIKVYLPATIGEKEQANGQRKTLIPRGRGETILVVEDDPAILSLAALMLESINYVVLTAQSPELALRIVESHGGMISLVLTDVIMPSMNGREMLSQLEELRPGIKGLFMSGYTANMIEQHGVLESGVAFIHKPFSKYDLAVQVRDVLAG